MTCFAKAISRTKPKKSYTSALNNLQDAGNARKLYFRANPPRKYWSLSQCTHYL